MRRRVVVVLGIATLLAAAALAQDSGRKPSDKTLKAIGEGRAVYLVHCMGCHGPHARGALTGTDGQMAPDLTLIAVRDGRFDPVDVANHIDGRDRCATIGGRRLVSSVDMPCWGKHFRGEGSKSDGYAATRVFVLTKYLEFAQAPEAEPATQ